MLFAWQPWLCVATSRALTNSTYQGMYSTYPHAIRSAALKDLRTIPLYDRLDLLGSGCVCLWPTMEPWAPGPMVVDSEAESSATLSDTGQDAAGIDVSALFGLVSLPHVDLEAVTLPTSRGQGETMQHETRTDLSHMSLLKEALNVSGIARNIPRRTRRSGKFAFDVRVLRDLGSDPSRVTRSTTLTRQEYKTGFHEFRRWYIAFSGMAWRPGEKSAMQQWSTLTNNERYHWLLIFKACGSLGCPHVGKATPAQLRRASKSHVVEDDPSADSVDQSAEERFIEAFGLLLTYQTKLGIDDPEVGAWIQEGLRGEALRQKLLSKPAYRTFFEAFVAFMQNIRDKYKFKTFAACMELGEDSRFSARVHLHAYIGFLQKDGGTSGLKSVRVKVSDLNFYGSVPFIVPSKGRHGRRLHDAIGQGMYYVAGPKSSCMLRFTDLEPIKDRVVTSRSP